jgi:hypothetical protein
LVILSAAKNLSMTAQTVGVLRSGGTGTIFIGITVLAHFYGVIPRIE